MVYRLVSKTNEGFLHEGSTPSSPTANGGRRLKHSHKTDSPINNNYEIAKPTSR